MTRRALIFAAVAGAAFADASSEALDAIASMAAALAEDSAPGFEAALSKDLPKRAELISNVRAMLEQAEITSTVEQITDDGDDNTRKLVLDWSMHLKRKGDDLRIDQRRESITVTVIREGKKWKARAIDPMAFFAPPNFR